MVVRLRANAPWVLLGGAVVGFGYFYFGHFAPLTRDHASLTAHEQEAGENLTGARSELKKLTARADKLDKENTSLKAKVEAAARPLEDARGDLTTVKSALEKSMAKGLKSGAVTILEKWESLNALKAHLAAPHMAEYREKVKDLVVGVKLQVVEPA